jgi:2-oxoglutarate ferredoxin oxidoreductase subunit alpha
MAQDLILGMAGSGGDGVVSAGESLLSAASATGYHAIMTKSFGSQIRGGESSCRVRVSTRPLLNPGGALDVAVALNWEDFLKFGAELPLSTQTVFLYEEKAGPPPAQLNRGPGAADAAGAGAGQRELTKQAAGTDKAKTSVVLGLLAGWFGLPGEAILKGLKKKFGTKGEGLLEANEQALEAGITYAKAHPLPGAKVLAGTRKGAPKLLCDGNDMCAAGALFRRCRVLQRLPHHPVDRGDADTHQGDLEVRRRGAAGGRRDRGHRRGGGRFVRWQEGDDRYQRAGHGR